jgi:sugar phosphate isomerase/epimerase
MHQERVKFSVFTKPWKSLPIEELAVKIQSFGFDGIELPIREGFQVEPQHAGKELPALSRRMAEYGLQIYSVASSTDENIFAACAEAGIPIIRIMLDIDFNEGYYASETKIRLYLDSLKPLCEKYGVQIGIQQHSGATRVKNSAGLLRFLEHMDSRSFGAIWDAGHDGIRGEGPNIGLDMVWSHLCMVNLKNAFYSRISGPDAGQAEWKTCFTTGREGMASWPAVAEYLGKRQYNGVICLTAEYDDEENVDRNIQEDLVYAKSLFGTDL